MTQPRTTDSRHDLPVAENLLNRQFHPQAPNRAWVADMTRQYASHAHRALLTKHGLIASMSRKGNCWRSGRDGTLLPEPEFRKGQLLKSSYHLPTDHYIAGLGVERRAAVLGELRVARHWEATSVSSQSRKAISLGRLAHSGR